MRKARTKDSQLSNTALEREKSFFQILGKKIEPGQHEMRLCTEFDGLKKAGDLRGLRKV